MTKDVIRSNTPKTCSWTEISSSATLWTVMPSSSVRVCATFWHLFGFTLAGYTPAPDLVWIDGSVLTRSLPSFAGLLAHAYYLHKHTLVIGTLTGLCEYAMILLSGGGSTATGYGTEEDAYEFEANMTNCIFKIIDLPVPLHFRGLAIAWLCLESSDSLSLAVGGSGVPRQ
jgi:hypothetical protein